MFQFNQYDYRFIRTLDNELDKVIPEAESILIPVYEVEAVQPPVCLAPLVVDPSGIASILSFSAETESFLASSSSFESPLTYK